MFDKPDFTRESFEELLRINNDLRRENNNLLGDIKIIIKIRKTSLLIKKILSKTLKCLEPKITN